MVRWITLLALIVTAPFGLAQRNFISERKIAGTSSDLMEVRYLVLRGDNVWIGEQLAAIAKKIYHVKLAQFQPGVGSDQMKWLTSNYPERVQRARGVGKVFGESAAEGYDTTTLYYDMDPLRACSVVYYPGSAVSNRHAMMSRNYDFPKRTYAELTGKKPAPGDRSMTGDPYVIKMAPKEGYPSLFTCSYDLEGGAIDGVNSRGVCVALLADDMSKVKTRGRAGFGLSEADLPRFVLDRAASAKQARALLRNVPYNATFSPCHYIIGDASGDSFIFEVAADGKHYIIDGKDKPQIVTNHSIAEYGTTNLPQGDSFDRYRKLRAQLASHHGKFTPNDVKVINYCVAVPAEVQVAATLWHAVYDLKTRSVQISFCLSRADEAKERRTPYFRFSLGH